tara:strand:- start:263 stop:514 length:252 start_codon:yes stop_codon:yes gene_type:complete
LKKHRNKYQEEYDSIDDMTAAASGTSIENIYATHDKAMDIIEKYWNEERRLLHKTMDIFMICIGVGLAMGVEIVIFCKYITAG